MRIPISALPMLLLLSSPAAFGQPGRGAGDDGREPLVTHEYACLAVDCRAIASRLGGSVIEDPLADLARAGARFRHRGGGFLAAGHAPYYGDVFAQLDGGGGGRGPGFGGGGALHAWIPEGLEPPVAIAEQNVVILRGTQQAIDETLELLALIDRPAPMVRIDLQAISAPVEFDRGRSLQWQALGPGDMVVGGGAGSGAGNLGLRWALGDIGLAFADFENESRGHAEETLFIVTESGMPAYIGVRCVEPSFLPQRVYDRHGNVYTVYDVVYSAIETSLFVVPRVNHNNTVTMFLAPYFSGKIGEVQVPGGSAFPIIQSRDLSTLVTVRNGETFAIGGFRRIVIDETYQGAGPVEAADLPRIRRGAHVEDVTIFVTPTIIDPEDMGFDDIAL